MTAELETHSRVPTRPALARVVDKVLSSILRLTGVQNDYRVERDVPMTTRDGVVLLADHYVPLTEHARGTVLVRTPYGRGFPSDLLDARVYASRGYHVLLQSSRGTFGSGGTFEPMACEVDDAQDAVAWLRAQPWFDGRLATVGGSYLAWTQWALLLDPPPELSAAAILVGPHDWSATTYGTGAFGLRDFLVWSESIVHQEETSVRKRLLNVATASRRLAPAFTDLPLADTAEGVLEHRAPWFRAWLSHPDRSDPFWERRNGEQALQRVSVPVRLLSGWQDPFLEQTMQQYEVLHARGLLVALTVGPWTHTQVATKGAQRIVHGNLEWLNEHLAGEAAPARPRVEVFVTGANTWRELPEWPPPTIEQMQYLQPGGRLTAAEPTGAGPSSSLHYDPADPTPTLGGRIIPPAAGVRDNRPLEARVDVLTFSTPPLTAALEIVGRPVVELAHSRDNPHGDVFVRLCDVDPKGRSRNFSDGYLRLNPTSPTAEAQRLQVRLDPCAHRLAAGHRLRLLVAGGSHPRFARNEGTGAPPGTGSELRPCLHTVHHAPGAASRVILPVSLG